MIATILLPVAIGVASSAVLVRLHMALFRRSRQLDRPGAETHKAHARAVPYGGGPGMAMAIVVTLALTVLLVGDAGRASGLRIAPLWPIGAGAFLLFVLGLIDDSRPQTPGVKLLVQSAAVILAVSFSDLRIDLIHDLPWLAYALAGLWCLVVTNAFNLLDHADGLSATTASISLTVLVSASLASGDVQLAMILLALIGVLGGFLIWNRPPARVYMGDAGSLPLGFLIATGCLAVTFWHSGDADGGTRLAVLAPLLVTAIPLYDTAVVVCKRLRHRRGIMHGDRNHISHRLGRLGLSPRASLAVVAALQTGLAASALLLRDADPTTAGIVLLQAISVLIAATLLEARRDRFT